MVSNLSLCLTLGLLTCNPNSMSEDIITQQKHYSQLDSTDVEQMVSELYSMQISYETFTLEEMDRALNTYNYLLGYQDYLDEQKRIEQERIAEEQRKREEEQTRLEQERQHQEWLDSFDRQGFRQTYYGTFENEKSVGAGFSHFSPEITDIGGVYHYLDSEYGYVQVVAISLNEVISSGQNSRGIWNIYGSIIEMKYSSGDVRKAIILDACSACDRANKIDLWVSTPQPAFDIEGIDWRFIRRGW